MSSRSKLGEPDSQQGFSVVFDAVALLPSQEGVVPLCQEATARDFLADAFAHLKFIGYVSAAVPLFERAAVPLEGDEAIIALDDPSKVAVFVEACGKLRHWERGSEVKLPLAAEQPAGLGQGPGRLRLAQHPAPPAFDSPDDHGTWYRILTRDNRRYDDLKSSLGKTDYHTMGACYGVLRAIAAAR